MNRMWKQICKKQSMIQLMLAALSLLAMLLVAGCGNSDEQGSKKVAISFANSSESWQRNGQSIKDALEAEGFQVDLQFADTDVKQAEQIQELIAGGPKCLVIGAVNSTTLGDALKLAKEKNIPVIAYDRLIMNTDAVSYYASFDNEAVGNAMGYYIEAALNLKSGAGPFNFEAFAGDPDDNNAHLFFDGAMNILKPYIDKGQLVCRSGELSFDKVNTKGWEPKHAAARMDKLLKQYYADGAGIDVILSPNDGIAGGIRDGMAQAGYGGGMPILTGQDADPKALQAIKEGKQSITIFKDPAQLSAKCIRMIKAVVEGTQPSVNDVTTYNNGVITVPSYLCIPKIIDKDNLGDVK